MSARVFVASLIGVVMVAGITRADAPGDPGPGDPLISDPLEDGSAEHPFDAIQEGIDAAVDGDHVVVADGMYTGIGNKNLDYAGRLIKVRSASDNPALCVIDCEGSGRGFYFHSGETADAVVAGLTITGGYVDEESMDDPDGGGVRCVDSSPTLINCRISGNVAGNLSDGAGVCCWNSSARLIDCTISGNTCYYVGLGGGLCCNYNGDVALINCTISGNYDDGGGGGVCCVQSSPTLNECTISGNVANLGGGVACFGSDPRLTNCTISGNEAGSGGGVSCALQSAPELTNCTIIGNQANAGGGVLCNGSSPMLVNCILWGDTPQEIFLPSGLPMITYCDVQGGWPGDGNIDVDPLLTLDGHLQAESPCREAGDPNGSYEGEVDMDGEPRVVGDCVDIGTDEFLDTDDDSLPNWWEQLHFGSPEAADPSADEDGDGRTNLEEYVGGTDPIHGPQTYYVDTAGEDSWDGLSPIWDGEHGPKATIRAALDAANPCERDTVVIADGTYTGVGNRDLDLQGNAVTVRSASGDPASCVIDCQSSGRGFYFHSGETAASVVQGLTVTGADVDSSSPGGPRGAGAFCCILSSPTLINCSFAGNRALYGAGVYARFSSRPTLTGCTIAGNVADGRGGGMLCYESDSKLANCTIRGNLATERGGGVYCHDSDPTLTNCTISGNEAGEYGGGLYCRYESDPTLTNCILWADTPQEIHATGDGHCSPEVTYCVVEDGWPGEGNIESDPLFVDPANEDYHLSPGSPCIDAGDNDGVAADVLDLDGDGDTTEPIPIDLDGRLRFADRAGTPDTGNPGAPGPPIVDIGAYEYQCDGDLDGDGDIDLPDLAQLLSNYGTTSGACYADGDIDLDGDVDLSDLSALLAVYGTTCP